MKSLRHLVVFILLAGVFFGAGSLFIKPAWSIDASILIPAPVETLYQRIQSPRTWPEWSAWSRERYPDREFTFTGAPQGAGAGMAWSGDKRAGEMEIVEIEKNRLVGYRMTTGRYTLTGQIRLADHGNLSQVEWTCSGNTGLNPLARYRMLLYRPLVKQQVRRSLAQLKINPGRTP